MKLVRRRWLHLLWTVPVALVISIPLWIVAGLAWCGVSGCSGGGFGIARGEEATAWTLLAVSGGLLFTAVAAVPWLRPWWVRLLVSLIVGALLFVLGIYFTGGPTPPEGQSGGWAP